MNNPISKKNLHPSEPPTPFPLPEERTPFNDAIKHGDIVQGFQTPKKIEQYPRWFQNPRKIYAIISLLGMSAVLIYQLIQTISEMISRR